jgi:carboxypeptidase C (cathepsin A)
MDAKVRVLVAHGLLDLVTPYLATDLLLGAIAPAAGGDRVRLETFMAGHMVYTTDAGRAGLGEAARRFVFDA